MEKKVDITYLGKDGEFPPKVTITGGEIQRHYHKRGLKGGYYVIVPTKAPDNLDDLLKQANKVKDEHVKSDKTTKTPVAKTDGKDGD